MTPALKLAKECGLIGEWTQGYKQYGVFPLHLTSEYVEKLLSTYYARAQAQALRDAATWDWYLAAAGDHIQRRLNELADELENIATAEWREFDPDTRRCAYEFVLWAQSRARHTLNRVLSGDVTAPLPEKVKLVQVGPCSCSDHECGECMKPEEDPATTKLDEMVLREKS